MKKYLHVIIAFSLFGLIAFWLFIKPIFDSKMETLAGEVVSITKMKRSGDYVIELNERGKPRFVNYSFFDNNFDIRVGDSLFKQSNEALFIKSKEDGIMRLAIDQNVLIQ